MIELYNGKGYVRLVDHMGSDLSFTKAARASFAKDSPEWNYKEERLLAFLIREDHMSVFRHAAVTFQIKAPLMVARQHWKYVVASAHIDDQNGWNETSRRYVSVDNEFYVPRHNQWRSKPENAKQGSGPVIDSLTGRTATYVLEDHIKRSVDLFDQALDAGIATEQARLFLPAFGLMQYYQWTVSIANLIHFFKERLAHDAQLEMQELAQAVYQLTAPLYPATFKALGLTDTELEQHDTD
jgi:thymidylate synthase (FAD)